MANIKILEKAVDDGNMYMQAQLKVANSNDIRASLLAVIALLHISMMITYLIIMYDDIPTKGILWLGLVIIPPNVISIGLCLFSARSCCMYYPGNVPENYQEDFDGVKTYEDCLTEIYYYVNSNIKSNSKMIRLNAELFNIGLFITITTLLISVIYMLMYLAP